jgi:hypothetical protein
MPECRSAEIPVFNNDEKNDARCSKACHDLTASLPQNFLEIERNRSENCQQFLCQAKNFHSGKFNRER